MNLVYLFHFDDNLKKLYYYVYFTIIVIVRFGLYNNFYNPNAFIAGIWQSSLIWHSQMRFLHCSALLKSLPWCIKQSFLFIHYKQDKLFKTSIQCGNCMITTGIGNLNFKDLKFMTYPYSDLPEMYFHLFLVQGCNDLLANGSKTTGIYQLQVLISTTFYELFVKAFQYSKSVFIFPGKRKKLLIKCR